MNPASPVAPAPAWTTAWPAAVAAATLLYALWRSRDDFTLRHRPWGWLLAAGAAAVAVRGLWIPGFTEHVYDGHEADYLDFFLGRRSPTRGGTVLYPAMQWLYWLSGHLLRGRAWPVLMNLAFGVASIGVAAALSARLFGRRAGIYTGVLLVLYGNHAFWSTSAYNVMLPMLLVLVALWGVVRLNETGRSAHALLAAGAGALAVATRLESVVAAAPAFLLLLRPPRRGWRRWPLLVGGAGLAVAAAIPLLWPGGVPGEGERWLSFRIHAGMFTFLEPWSHPYALLLAALAFLPRARGHRIPAAILLAWAVLTHLVMATFDDYGWRHALPAGVALAMTVSAGLAPLRPRHGLLAAAPLGLLLVLDTAEIARRYYAPDTAFTASLPPDLPRRPIPRSPPCTVVGEDPRVAQEPPLSHFNLLDPCEARRLRAREGCLYWCMDLQDWRWSSRGVRPRALRLQRLYVLQPLAVWEDAATGYTCLLHGVGKRRIAP